MIFALKKRNLNKQNFIVVFFAFVILLLIIAIILSPQYYINSATNGLTAFVTKVLPSLFPFFVLTKILTELDVFGGISKALEKPTKFLFGAPGVAAYVFIIGLICGYPVSAKINADLFLSRKITENDAVKIASFTSTSGPMFVIGTVGAALFNNVSLGALILLCHALGALITGVIFRCYGAHKKKRGVMVAATQTDLPTTPPNHPKVSSAINNAMFSSINSVLIVGGFIVVFYIIIDCIFSLVNLTGISRVLVGGVVEMTRGLIELSTLALPANIYLIVSTFLISFGGLSIIMQAFYFLNNAHIKLGTFILIKIVHAASATLLAFLISLLL